MFKKVLLVVTLIALLLSACVPAAAPVSEQIPVVPAARGEQPSSTAAITAPMGAVSAVPVVESTDQGARILAGPNPWIVYIAHAQYGHALAFHPVNGVPIRFCEFDFATTRGGTLIYIGPRELVPEFSLLRDTENVTDYKSYDEAFAYAREQALAMPGGLSVHGCAVDANYSPSDLIFDGR